jgi:predicted phosphodiesterase
MKLGIVSDIHGNAAGLVAACRLLRARGAERIVCCGDIAGYSAQVGEVLAVLRQENVTSVAGNHDAMLRSRSWPAENVLKSAPLRFAADTLPAADLDMLAALPQVLEWDGEGRRLQMLHGMPADPLEGYLYPHLASSMALPEGIDLLLVGHTHMQFHLGAIINPGSCGLPRDGDPRAACTLLNEATGETTDYRVLYDPSEVAAANRLAGFDAAIDDYLFAGRRLPARASVRDALLDDAIETLRGKGLHVALNAAGFMAARDESGGAAVFALRLADGSHLLASTPVAYAWQPARSIEAPSGFQVARNRVATFFECVLPGAGAVTVADALLRVVQAAELERE